MTESDLENWFIAHGAAWTKIEHPPTHRVADSADLRGALEGSQTKSLLVEDKAGCMTLIVATGACRVNLKGVARSLDATGRLSFAAPDRLMDSLGVTPGNATPLALPRDENHLIANVVLDEQLFEHPPLWCHPLRNTASVSLAPDALVAFITEHHSVPHILSVATA
ncbi:YbaK/EbsC family protein [Parvularcula sp. LCG005]|uniref:YbaK/EbsC family protein n=1 Tax=Parvularcula sp. LCG005 TaxID=3078805 RepID=UPI0029437076|nr:YbaK/EbsC family protein [Parvularcula sp. LCG005]WOI53448.1 YbaK/EbsC family protein [Parvularcula sp. LCG005]